MKKIITIVSVLAIGIGLLTACENQANVASRNLSVAADNFEIQRRFVSTTLIPILT